MKGKIFPFISLFTCGFAYW